MSLLEGKKKKKKANKQTVVLKGLRICVMEHSCVNGQDSLDRHSSYSFEDRGDSALGIYIQTLVK